ncbi:hypothetical protein Y032_0021g434 [Ancylostoma ceylanicum]|uniref:Uncharacterized protein n=1 Tax=Ancylostoma ceylanicum TaxID=53326 RepID=A0A016V232_9BILA|nr:hypothetical protein Y032_0021g434 [Ancylostoma ceylanicum]
MCWCLYRQWVNLCGVTRLPGVISLMHAAPALISGYRLPLVRLVIIRSLQVFHFAHKPYTETEHKDKFPPALISKGEKTRYGV